MAWQAVGKNRRYYYRYRWYRGRAIRQYVGIASDLFAQLAAAEDEQRRASKATQSASWLNEQTRLATASAPLLALCERSDCLVRAALLAAGFHQHSRAWRLRRDHRRHSQDI